MEQLLSQLGESLSVGDMGELGEGGGEELPREVVQVDQDRSHENNIQSLPLQVMQVLESQMSGQPVKPEVSAEERVERCREKQGLLESRCLVGKLQTISLHNCLNYWREYSRSVS